MAKQKERESRKTLDLSRAEKAFLSGLQAREREIQRDIIVPLQEDYQEFVNQIQFNHGVTLGVDYTLNAASGELVPIAEPNSVDEGKKLRLVKPSSKEDAAPVEE